MTQQETKRVTTYEVDTPFGAGVLWCWGEEVRVTQAYKYADASKVATFEVNGIPMYIDVTLHLNDAGAYVAKDGHAVNLRRVDGKDPSYAARAKVRDQMIPWINEYMREHPEVRVMGFEVFMHNETVNAWNAQEKAEEALEAARTAYKDELARYVAYRAHNGLT